MSKVVAIHSFRGGTGKTNTAANLAVVLARWGYRVGLVDSDLKSPGLHILFGLEQDALPHTLNHYLWHTCEIHAATYDVTPSEIAKLQGGKVFLTPASLRAEDIIRIVNDGYDANHLFGGMRDLGDRLNLDYLLLDTHPGLNRETPLSLRLADLVAFVLCPDSQDFQGTAVMINILQQLGIPKPLMVVNRVLSSLDPTEVRTLVEHTFKLPVAGILPNCDELLLLASRGIFVLDQPTHPLSEELEAIACQLKARL